MKFSELIVLLPCHSFDDFPMYHLGEAAEGLLSAWSALWHPRLLASAGKTPGWRRVDDPPSELAGRLIVIPTVLQSEVPAGFVPRAKSEGATLIRKLHKRSEIVAAALAALDAPAEPNSAAAESAPPVDSAIAPPPPITLDPVLEADFLTLGLCYLQTDLLTRRMRYLSNLDEAYFQTQTLDAAAALLAGKNDEAHAALRRAFDVLAEVRGHFYPQDVALIDLTLVAGTTIGQTLRDELARNLPVNLLISAEVVEQMAQQEPESLSALRNAIDSGRATLIGGERCERELPLMSPEAILAELSAGLAVYRRHLGVRPTLFGRRRFGLTPALPQILNRLGFVGALHYTLDDGQFPGGDRTKSRWEGADGTPLEALARVPLDANLPESFLSLPEKTGDTMDHDHVAALTFAHWPTTNSPFYRDLRRMAEYGNVLGRFVSLTQFFDNSDHTGVYHKHVADEYRSPYLYQAIVRRKADAVSSYAVQARQELADSATKTIQTLAALVSGNAALTGDMQAGVANESPPPTAALSLFANALPRESANSPPGLLVVNPLSFGRQMLVDVSSLPALPDVASPVLAAADTDGRSYAVVDVPPLGYAWIGPGKTLEKSTRRGTPTGIAQSNNVLRNEFCEVVIHPKSGGVQSVHDLRTRGNRMSQQISLRTPPLLNSSDSAYSSMVADSVATTISNSALGEVTSRGRLVDERGVRVARFVQRTQLAYGSRVVQVEIDLEPSEELRADPWNSYYCARFAWPDAAAELRRSVQWGSHVTETRRLEAPQFVEVKIGDLRTSIITAGLPWHQHSGKRMLDSLLLVRGETARQFRFGIGVDLPQPLHAALEMMSPTTVLPQVPAIAAANRTGWFFHVDVKNVWVTHLSPLVEEGQVSGFRTRLLEIAGRSVQARLRGFRPIGTAETVDFTGEKLAELALQNDRLDVHLGAHEWLEIVARWKK